MHEIETRRSKSARSRTRWIATTAALAVTAVGLALVMGAGGASGHQLSDGSLYLCGYVLRNHG